MQLRYQDGLLLAERVRPPVRQLHAMLLAAATALGLGSVGVLVLDVSFPLSLGLALVSAGLLFASYLLDRRARGRLGFVVSFTGYTLRLDSLTKTGAPRTELVPFERLRALEVERTPHGYRLEIEFEGPDQRPTRRALIPAAHPDELSSLERLEHLLRGAFDLPPTTRGEAPAPPSSPRPASS